MMEARRSGNYEQWVKFFLQTIYESSFDAIATIDKLTALREKNLSVVGNFWRSAKTAIKLFSYVEENPIIEINMTANALEMSYNTVSNAVARLREAGILVQSAGKRRNRAFAYGEYLLILREGT